MFGFNPFEQIDVVQYTVEIHIGNSVQTQSVSQPSIIAIQQAIQICQEVYQNPSPMKVVWKMVEQVDKDKSIEKKIEFGNQAWTKEFGEVGNNSNE